MAREEKKELLVDCEEDFGVKLGFLPTLVLDSHSISLNKGLFS